MSGSNSGWHGGVVQAGPVENLPLGWDWKMVVRPRPTAHLWAYHGWRRGPAHFITRSERTHVESNPKANTCGFCLHTSSKHSEADTL
ncbi:hypothetical protein E2C01_059552 [Portunus trituberculatus]|uniref:Uncharacterized protein n=1 Tax=Portunus trituberculatus TaxID=210409 RepID=A0A5B7H8Q2_PORTR|nr:hypothetical protein [Portunus trituberculatus]